MKLLNKKEFLKLPEGTMYLSLDPSMIGKECHIFYGLNIKGISIGNVDFAYTSLSSPDFLESDCTETHFEIWRKIWDKEEHELTFDVYGRDGMYEDKEMFCVLNKKEVKSLLDVITEAYNSYK